MLIDKETKMLLNTILQLVYSDLFCSYEYILFYYMKNIIKIII